MKLIQIIYFLLPELVLLLLPFHAPAQGIRIGEDAHLVITDSARLVLNDAGWLNNGHFTAGKSQIMLAGNNIGASSFIAGNRPISFYTISINKTAGDVMLGNNIAVEKDIAMVSGNLQLNNYTLDLGNSGRIVGERNDACITGKNGGLVRATVFLYAHHPVNPGNIGVEINSDISPGLTVITRGHVQQTNVAGQTGIQRWFDIVPTQNVQLHASLRFYYLDGELDGGSNNELSVFSSSAGQADWKLWGKDNADAAGGWVLKNNIDQLHRFTLAIPGGKSGKGDGVSTVQVFPNPARNAFTILLYSNAERDAVIYLYDQPGHQLEAKRIHCQAGINRIDWNIQPYAAGSYWLVFENLDQKNIKLLKQ